MLFCAIALLAGCSILTEDVPEEAVVEVNAVLNFELACEERGYDRAVGCVATCGIGASPALGVELELFRYLGAGATYAADTEASDFDSRCGRTTWRTCRSNRFEGLDCDQRSRPYCATCTPEGVSLADSNGYQDGYPVVPRAVILASPLPSMMEGLFLGEAGSCLADCIATVSRSKCGGCASGEGCLETAFGEVCHPRGVVTAGGACRGNQDCDSLECEAEEALCAAR